MTKLHFSIVFFTILFISCIPPQENTKNNKLLTRADIIHNNILTLDSHTETPMRLLDSEFDISKKNSSGKTNSKIDFPRMK